MRSGTLKHVRLNLWGGRNIATAHDMLPEACGARTGLFIASENDDLVCIILGRPRPVTAVVKLAARELPLLEITYALTARAHDDRRWAVIVPRVNMIVNIPIWVGR